MSMRDKVEELRRRRAEALRMGGEERLRRQRERGKLDARKRLELLLDPGSFVEIGLLATHLGQLPEEAQRPAPAESTSQIIGIRSRSASSRRRVTLRSPTGPMLPPCTVKS